MELAIFAKRNENGFVREKAMTARFAGTCKMCRGEIREGEPIFYNPRSGARHQNCCKQTGRTLAQIVVDYINANPHLHRPSADDTLTDALHSTLIRRTTEYKLVVDVERTRALPEAWAIFADGSAMRPIAGDSEGRFETFDPQ